MSHWQIGDVRITEFVEKEFAGERAPLSLVGRHPVHRPTEDDMPLN